MGVRDEITLHRLLHTLKDGWFSKGEPLDMDKLEYRYWSEVVRRELSAALRADANNAKFMHELRNAVDVARSRRHSGLIPKNELRD